MDEPGHPHPLPSSTPVGCGPDRRFDAIAALTSRLIDAPTALVSFVDRTQQVFPGAMGLPSPWQEIRFTPLTHSFCQHVVTSGAPLVLSDARTIERFANNPAIADLGVVAYAGFPLVDIRGRAVGSLCVIDPQPREWSERECAMLAELAAYCSSELEPRTTGLRDALVADRDRMAEELQHGVVSDLLALSILLGGVRSHATVDSADMIDDAIDAVDQIIARLRAAVVHAAER
ncbi:GAF domain-containing protein [uncultured Jatrophihabitans sp.]|uniref:GAF domain-containing protein n=1 Tax=uncultured Jatrophihabitans sp. TaxID=1610747 RepID=UPI0035C96CF3